MGNYSTFTNLYTPMSYNDILTPIKELTEYHNKMQESLIDYDNTTAFMHGLDKDDPEQAPFYNALNAFRNDLKTASQRIAETGVISPDVMDTLLRAKSTYAHQVVPIENAFKKVGEYNKVLADAYSKDPSAIPLYDNPGIVDFYNNPNLMPEVLSGNAIAKMASDHVIPLAKQIIGDPANSFYYMTQLGEFYDYLINTPGVTAQELYDYVRESGKGSELLQTIEDLLYKSIDSTGKWNTREDAIRQNIRRGFSSSLGQSTVTPLQRYSIGTGGSGSGLGGAVNGIKREELPHIVPSNVETGDFSPERLDKVEEFATALFKPKGDIKEFLSQREDMPVLPDIQGMTLGDFLSFNGIETISNPLLINEQKYGISLPNATMPGTSIPSVSNINYKGYNEKFDNILKSINLFTPNGSLITKSMAREAIVAAYTANTGKKMTEKEATALENTLNKAYNELSKYIYGHNIYGSEAISKEKIFSGLKNRFKHYGNQRMPLINYTPDNDKMILTSLIKFIGRDENNKIYLKELKFHDDGKGTMGYKGSDDHVDTIDANKLLAKEGEVSKLDIRIAVNDKYTGLVLMHDKKMYELPLELIDSSLGDPLNLRNQLEAYKKFVNEYIKPVQSDTTISDEERSARLENLNEAASRLLQGIMLRLNTILSNNITKATTDGK